MASWKLREGTRMLSDALRLSVVPDSLTLRTSPPSEVVICWTAWLVAHGSLERMSILAVMMRLRSALTTTVGMPWSGAGAAALTAVESAV